jgi:DNA-binding CsgD family transcriptional regulator
LCSSIGVEIPDFTHALITESRGRLRLAQSRPEDAIIELREAGRRWDAIGMVNPGIARWRCEAAQALLGLGEVEEARALAHRQLAIARGAGASWALAMALRTAAAVEGGETGLAYLDEALALLDGSEVRLECAHVLTERGSALRALGRRDEARDALTRGLDLARACGATRLAERAFGELEASGAHPRKLLRGGVDALTPSERRVASMAAEGLSNKEIAQTLFVTVRTVETHLRHTYKKLDIGSREQLEGALSGRETAAER